MLENKQLKLIIGKKFFHNFSTDRGDSAGRMEKSFDLCDEERQVESVWAQRMGLEVENEQQPTVVSQLVVYLN